MTDTTAAAAKPARVRIFNLRSVIMLLALVALASSLAVAAASPYRAYADETSPYVIDKYGSGLFSTDQYNELESEAKATSEKYNVGVYLLVVNDIGSQSARTYAKDYYVQNGLGMGSDKSGILFLIAVDSRDYVTVTHGDGVNAFTDWQIDQMEDAIKGKLSGDNWYEAGKTYLDMADSTLAFRAEKGEPLDSDNAPKSIWEILLGIAVGLGVALAGAFLLDVFARSKMKSAVIATSADDYLDRTSFVLLSQDDTFVNTTVVATPRVKVESGGGGFGGGSSIDSGGFGGSSGGKF